MYFVPPMAGRGLKVYLDKTKDGLPNIGMQARWRSLNL
jgi:hypothetical protein